MTNESAAYKAGYDCGINGANTTNSHFKYFLTNSSTMQWEQGKKDAEIKKSELNELNKTENK